MGGHTEADFKEIGNGSKSHLIFHPFKTKHLRKVRPWN